MQAYGKVILVPGSLFFFVFYLNISKSRIFKFDISHYLKRYCLGFWSHDLLQPRLCAIHQCSGAAVHRPASGAFLHLIAGS